MKSHELEGIYVVEDNGTHNINVVENTLVLKYTDPGVFITRKIPLYMKYQYIFILYIP